MIVDYSVLYLILLAIVSLFGFTRILVKDKTHRILTYIFILGFSVYSGIGLAFYNIDHTFLYLGEFVLFMMIFTVFGIRSSRIEEKNKSFVFSKGLDRVVENSSWFITIMAVIYVLTYIFPLIYPSFNLMEIFNIKALIKNYAVTPFYLRVIRKNDMLYQLITTQLRMLSTPFFFIYLYMKRKNTLLFLLVFLFPIYLETMYNSYLSRNEMAVVFAFIIAYLYKENKMNRKIIIVLILIVVPYILFFFEKLFYSRVGASSGNESIGEGIYNLVIKETTFVKNYDSAADSSSGISIFTFLLYIVTLPIPSFLTNIFGFVKPNLAEALTKNITGLFYGDTGYYLLLPSVLGEGIIIFNEYFAWVYAFVFAPLAFLFLRKLKSNNVLTYLMYWYILDFARQMRGGSQFILSTWINTLVPFAVIIFLFNSFRKS